MPDRPAEFITALHVEPISDIDWLVVSPFLFYSAVLENTIGVPVGFHTDFASVPRLPVVYLLCGGVAVRPAVIHDYLYRTQSATRRDADAVFEEAMALTGQPWWRRRMMWLGVRAFGGLHYHGVKKEEPVRALMAAMPPKFRREQMFTSH